MNSNHFPCRWLAPAVALLIAGCAGLPADRGAGDVRQLVAERSGRTLPAPDADTRALVAELLSQALTPETSAQIALVNNPEMRATYARLGLAAAEIYNAGRLSNPYLGVGTRSSNEAGTANQLTFGLAQSFTDLLLLPSRSRLARAEFEHAKLEAGAAILNLTADVETAYYELVGARQVLAMRETIALAAQAAADLAQRFFDAGNINALELALEQSGASQARLDAMQAAAEAKHARNTLNRRLGLRAGDRRWSPSESLPIPIAEEADFETLFDLAWTSRLDLAAKRAEVDRLADSLGVSRGYRFVGNIELGFETERETDGSRLSGPDLSLELPIFNSGAGRIAHAESQLQLAQAELQALTLEVGHAVELAHAQVMAARNRAEAYRTTLVPQREEIVRRTQEEVNYMLEGQFQLLQVKQQEYDAYQGYLESIRDYWLARVELARAVGAQLPSAATAGESTVEPRRPVEPSGTGMEGMDHGAMDHGAMHHTPNGDQP